METETGRPDVGKLKDELKRERNKARYHRAFRSVVFTFIAVAAVAVLVSTLWFPVLRIFGSSMSPSMKEGQIVVSIKTVNFKTGDIIGFYNGNKLLIKRCIAGPGDWVDIREDGTVLVNDVEIDEPYLIEKAFGDCNIELPYQVPDGRYFVMGDNRAVSVDSRNTAMGCVSEEQIVGRVLFCIWPLSDIGPIREDNE